jgi:hypothetical protein
MVDGWGGDGDHVAFDGTHVEGYRQIVSSYRVLFDTWLSRKWLD